MRAKFIAGVDLGGTNLKVALLDLKYRIIKKEIFRTKSFQKKENLISAIELSVKKIISDCGANPKEILGIGLGIAGPVDTFGGVVHYTTNIPGWHKVPLKKILEKRLKLPVFIDNDAKVMALAEHRVGSAFGFKNAICLTLGTGVGSGLIINGQIYRGDCNAAGEFGHVPINEQGPNCTCGGVACLESYIGNSRLKNEAKKFFKRVVTLEELSTLARNKNKKAIKIWQKAGSRLGFALVGIVNLLNLDAIVIGGGVANAGKVLFDKVRETVNKRAMQVQARHVKIFRAKLGSDAGLIGAAILVKERLGR